MNVPLLPYAGEADYLWALDRMLSEGLGAYKPDVLVTQLGADTHYGDPLANLGLTMTAYPPMASLIHRAVHDHCSDRWIATGGGGYQAETVVPKVWTMHFAEMCDATGAVPGDWLADHTPDSVSRPYRMEVERSVDAVLEACLPKLSALAT
jgi:acetoin utilization protein AcuC